MKISVVISIYNEEDYLEECLDSIVNQTLDDIEIICVDDGSTDNSMKILEHYASKDSRINIVRQKNSGHAVATNKGIKKATGKYLFLMDADDVLKEDALEKTFNAAEEKGVDFVLFQAIDYDDSKDKYYKSERYTMNRIINHVGDNIFNLDDLGELSLNVTVTPWSKLYNRKFICDNNITFPEGLIFDDNVFYWKTMLSARKIYFLKEYLYIRRWYDSSSTTAGNRNFIDSISINQMIIDLFRNEGKLDKIFKRRLYNRKISLALLRFKQIKKEYKQEYYERFEENMNEFMKEDNIHEYLQNNLKKDNIEFLEFFEKSDNALELELYLNNSELNQKLKELSEENVKIKKELEDKTKSFDELSLMFDQVNKENKDNKILIDEIMNSNSWKVTKPLRNIKKILK